MKIPEAPAGDDYFSRRQIIAEIKSLNMTQKAVLDAVSWRQGRNLWTYASLQSIADVAGCDRKTVKRALGALSHLLHVYKVAGFKTLCHGINTDALKGLLLPAEGLQFERVGTDDSTAEPTPIVDTKSVTVDSVSPAVDSVVQAVDVASPKQTKNLPVKSQSTNKGQRVVDRDFCLTSLDMLVVVRERDLSTFEAWDRQLAQRYGEWPDGDGSLVNRLALWHRCSTGRYRNGAKMSNPCGQFVQWYRARANEVHNATEADLTWAASIMLEASGNHPVVRKFAEHVSQPARTESKLVALLYGT